jgi:hypothetical protein
VEKPPAATAKMRFGGRLARDLTVKVENNSIIPGCGLDFEQAAFPGPISRKNVLAVTTGRECTRKR